MTVDEGDEDDYFDNEEESEPDYYVCMCCGYTCVEDHNGWGCPHCTAIMEEGYY